MPHTIVPSLAWEVSILARLLLSLRSYSALTSPLGITNFLLTDDGLVHVGSNSSLNVNHQVDLGGNTITNSGLDLLAFNNNFSTGIGGMVICEEGSCIGTGTINGNLVSGGTVSPDNLCGASAVLKPTTLFFLASGAVPLFNSRRRRH